jgi:hypothetical protein
MTMSQDFVIISNTAKIPTEKAVQIALILHRSVHDELYRVFQSSDPLRRGDYSQFFTVTFGDLLSYLIGHPDEFHSLLSAESWDGVSVVRDGTHYSFRDHHRGLVTCTQSVEGIEKAASRWLHWHLANQGLKKLYDHMVE